MVMWRDIKKWILYLYFVTGFVFGMVTTDLTGSEVDVFTSLLYTAFCIFAWLPILIIDWIMNIP